MKFIVHTTQIRKITNFATFSVIAKDEKQAKMKIDEKLNCTCLADRLKETDEDHQNIQEDKINYHIEEPNECNDEDFERSEFVCTCDISNSKLLKLAGLSNREIKKYFQKITDNLLK